MEAAASNTQPTPIDGFVEVSPEFINSLISNKDPFFDVLEKDNSNKLASDGKENNVNSNKNDDSDDDVEIIDDVNASGVSVVARKPSVMATNPIVGTSSETNGVTHDNSSSNTLSDVGNAHFANEDSRHSDHNYCSNNSTDNSILLDSGKTVGVSNRLNSSTNPNLNNTLLEDDPSIPSEERSFRLMLKTSFSFLDYRLHCTVCDFHIGTQLPSRVRFGDQEIAMLHPFLMVLICSKCSKVTRNFTRLTLDNHYVACSWCNELKANSQRCSECPSVFCESCIKRNLGSGHLNIVKKTTAWRCYKCDTQPIWRLRLIACELVRFLRKKRIDLMRNFPYAKPHDIKDIDISRCCKPLAPLGSDQPAPSDPVASSFLRKMLNNYPAATVQVERASTSYPHGMIPPRPPLPQSSYETPLFSLFSAVPETSESASQNITSSNVNLMKTQKLNNGHFLVTRQISHSSIVEKIKTFKADSFLKSADSTLKKPIELVEIDDTSENYIHSQNMRNENLPPPQLHAYSPISAVGYSAVKSSSNFMSQQPGPLISTNSGPLIPYSNQQNVYLLQAQKRNGGKTTKQEPVNRRFSSRIEWINNALLSSSALLDSCRNRLDAIDKVLINNHNKKDLEIKAANLLHSFTQIASAKFQEIDSQILENYWRVRKATGEKYKIYSYDKIAEEYANIIEESDNNSTTEVDPGSFLEVEIYGNQKMKTISSQNSNAPHDENNISDLKYPVVKLDRCDEQLSPFKSKLSTTLKTTKRNSVQYSNKIKGLIEKYGISESMVLLVPLEHLKAYK